MGQSTIYQYIDYKQYTRFWIDELSGITKGANAKLARELNVHPTLISQIINGHKNFTLDQAYKTSLFMGLNDDEREYFLLLVNYERVGDYELKKFYLKKIKLLSQESKQAEKKLPKSKKIDSKDLAIYYSDSLYIFIKLLTSLEQFDSEEKIAEYLQLPLGKLKPMIDFLCQTGLVIKKKKSLSMGTSMTHLGANSPWVSTHHRNWRLKAIEHLPLLSPYELSFTGPLSISRKDFDLVKNLLLEIIKNVGQIVDDTNPELVGCLNIDFFKLT